MMRLRDAGWCVLVYFATEIVVCFLVVLPMGFMFGLASGGGASPAAVKQWSQELAIPAATLLSVVAAGLALLHQLRRRELLAEVGWRRCRPGLAAGGLALGAGLGVCWWLAVVWLTSRGITPTGKGPLATMASGGGVATACWALLAVGAAPWIEETLFRGVLYQAFAVRWGSFVGGTLAVSLFLLSHYGEVVHFPFAAVTIGLMACLAQTLRIRTGSLAPGVALHMGYNSMIAIPVILARM